MQKACVLELRPAEPIARRAGKTEAFLRHAEQAGRHIPIQVFIMKHRDGVISVGDIVKNCFCLLIGDCHVVRGQGQIHAFREPVGAREQGNNNLSLVIAKLADDDLQRPFPVM